MQDTNISSRSAKSEHHLTDSPQQHPSLDRQPRGEEGLEDLVESEEATVDEMGVMGKQGGRGGAMGVMGNQGGRGGAMAAEAPKEGTGAVGMEEEAEEGEEKAEGEEEGKAEGGEGV